METKTNLSNSRQYIRFAVLDLDVVLEVITASKGRSDKKRVQLSGHTVRVSSPRLKTFKDKGINCVTCGAAGAFFAIEAALNGGQAPHLNLYAFNSTGDEVLMTVDHIVPLGDGGPDSLANLQPMCYPCNHEKSSEAGKRICCECNAGNGSHAKICSSFDLEKHYKYLEMQRVKNLARARCQTCNAVLPAHKKTCKHFTINPVFPRAVCLFTKREDGKILAVSRRNKPTEFGLPGGKVEGIETDEEALLREVKEETGLDVINCARAYRRLCRGEVSYLTTVYTGDVVGVPKTDEPIVVAWVDWDVLFNGPFGDYNKSLFAYLNWEEENG